MEQKNTKNGVDFKTVFTGDQVSFKFGLNRATDCTLLFGERPYFKIIRIFILFCFFGNFTTTIHAQCTAETPPTGLPGANCTNFYNSGWYSTSDASSIEYDNFVSGFHTTAVRLSDGSFKIWGEYSQPNGTSHFLTPTTINTTNFPAMTGTPYKIAISANAQTVLLTSDGLFAWGNAPGDIFDASVKNTAAFQKLSATQIVNANSFGLPSTVTPSQVKQMLAVPGALSILTCSGEVYMISRINLLIGSDDTYAANRWFRVETASTTFLTDVIAVRGSAAGFMALKSDGTLWTWGRGSYLGNGTANANRTFATQMTLPTTTSTIKMISVTGVATLSATSTITYFVLYADGNLYSMGSNVGKAIGDWTTTTRLTWVQPRYSSVSGPVMNDIKWISANEAGSIYGVNGSYQAVNVINNDKNVYAWGEDNGGMIGRGGGGAIIFTRDPGIPNGLTTADKIIQLETGGHTTMVIRECTNNFGYVGHRINGSMGDNTTTNTFEPNYTFNTASLDVIGASPVDFTANTPTFNSGCAICSTTSLSFTPSVPGGSWSITPGGTGTGTINPTTGVLTVTSPGGTINITYTGPAVTCNASKTRQYTFGICCNAGTAAVTLNGTTLSNSCPGTTTNLNSLVSGTPPVGTNVLWYTNDSHTGTAYATPTAATAGTYYAFYYDALADCYSPASAAVTVTIAPCCTVNTLSPNAN